MTKETKYRGYSIYEIKDGKYKTNAFYGTFNTKWECVSIIDEVCHEIAIREAIKNKRNN